MCLYESGTEEVRYGKEKKSFPKKSSQLVPDVDHLLLKNSGVTGAKIQHVPYTANTKPTPTFFSKHPANRNIFLNVCNFSPLDIIPGKEASSSHLCHHHYLLTALPPFFAIGGLLFVYCSQTLLSRTKEIVPGFAPFPSKTRR